MNSKRLTNVLRAIFSVSNLTAVAFIPGFVFAFVGFESIVRALWAAFFLLILHLISSEMGERKAHEQHEHLFSDLRRKVDKLEQILLKILDDVKRSGDDENSKPR